MFREDPNPRFRARALWLLSRLPGKGTEYLQDAVRGDQDDLKVVAIRAGRELTPPWRWSSVDVSAESSKVRRELAIALAADPAPAAAWAALARQYRGDDRWYLEALGIAAARRWDDCLSAYLKAVPDATSTKAGRDIIWRSRAARTPVLLAKIIADPATPSEELPRYFRAFDFLTGAAKRAAIEQLAFRTRSGDEARHSLIATEALNRLEASDVSRRPEEVAALRKVLDQTRGTPAFVAMVDRFRIQDRYPDLVNLAAAQPDSGLAVDAVKVLLGQGQRRLLKTALGGSDVEAASAMARAGQRRRSTCHAHADGGHRRQGRAAGRRPGGGQGAGQDHPGCARVAPAAPGEGPLTRIDASGRVRADRRRRSTTLA